MEQIIDDVSPASMIRAIEENGAEFLLAMGRAGGGEERRDAVHWSLGGSPIDYHNCVVRADLNQTSADAVLVASCEVMRRHSVSGVWHVGPGMRPADLGERLKAHGFIYDGDDIGMAADLHTIPASVPAPAGFTIREMLDESDLALWAGTLGRGFGESALEATWTGEVYRRLGFGPGTPWRHYLGSLYGVPAATATLFLGGGAAGIWFVFTIEEARRQGIGAAITLAALYDARALGYRVAALGSSPMGQSVYERIGFREYCRVRLYRWSEQ